MISDKYVMLLALLACVSMLTLALTVTGFNLEQLLQAMQLFLLSYF